MKHLALFTALAICLAALASCGRTGRVPSASPSSPMERRPGTEDGNVEDNGSEDGVLDPATSALPETTAGTEDPAVSHDAQDDRDADAEKTDGAGEEPGITELPVPSDRSEEPDASASPSADTAE